MENTTKTKLAYVGRGALNLVLVLIVVVGARVLMDSHVSNRVGLIALSVVLIVSYLAGVRWIERRQPSELLSRAGFSEFPAGLALGIALFTTVMLLLWISGVYHPTGWGTSPVGSGLMVAFAAAIFEEIIFRGFLFRLSARLLGTWSALALTAALFGLAHAFNHGATFGSSVAIALEAGLLLGAAFALTQRLWLPIGLHMGWNFTQGTIFGMSVSGGTTKSSLIAGALRGRDLLTGGVFGPEASIVAVVVCLAAAMGLLWKTVRRGRLEHSVWTPVPTTHYPQV